MRMERINHSKNIYKMGLMGFCFSYSLCNNEYS
jgi:hypothetical protein